MRVALGRWALLVRYYQAGIVNAAVGYGLYAGFVRLGLNLYVAQIVAHVLGTAFNYVSYSRHAFRGAAPAKLRFAIAYAANYFVSLATLAGARAFVHSPYLAGFISLGCASLINFFVLKHVVFTKAAA